MSGSIAIRLLGDFVLTLTGQIVQGLDSTRLHVLDGDRAAALRVYYHCATTLQRELDITPDAATQEAYQALLALDAPIAPLPLPDMVDTAMIGRSLEWEQLAQTWQQIASGHCPPLIAVISGEPGIGKTTLANELTGWIKRQGGAAASTACYAPESDLSLVLVVSWLRAISLSYLDPIWQAELARALPELISGHPQQIALPQKNEVRQEALAEAWQKRRFYEAMARAVLS
jgi:hypothetical protein